MQAGDREAMPANASSAAAHPASAHGEEQGAAKSESTNSSAEEGAGGQHPDYISDLPIGHEKSDMTSGSMHGILKSIVTLAPFVSKMLKDKVVLDTPGGKFAAFDTANMHDLISASKTLLPEMEGVQLAMMIADVKGFTALTEILSKKGE